MTIEATETLPSEMSVYYSAMSSDYSSVFFALDSVTWNSTRRLDGGEWIEFLGEHEMTPEEFERFHDWWWFDPKGQSLLVALTNNFIKSIVASLSENLGGYDWEEFLREIETSGAWSDFIRELYDAPKGESDYFLEYAVDQFVLFGLEDEVGENLTLEQLREGFRTWYESSEKEIREIFIEASEFIQKSDITGEV